MDKQAWKKWLEKQEPPFEVNDWGSCQYSTAKWFYDTFLKVVEDLGYEEALNLLKCKVEFEEIAPIREVQSALMNQLKDEVIELLDEEAYADAIGRIREIEQLKTLKSLESIFELCKDMSWDLWSTAEFIATFIFKDLKIEAPDSPGFGPKYNVLTQQENFRTGLYCALLKHFNLVTNDSCFAGFDT